MNVLWNWGAPFVRKWFSTLEFVSRLRTFECKNVRECEIDTSMWIMVLGEVCTCFLQHSLSGSFCYKMLRGLSFCSLLKMYLWFFLCFFFYIFTCAIAACYKAAVGAPCKTTIHKVLFLSWWLQSDRLNIKGALLNMWLLSLCLNALTWYRGWEESLIDNVAGYLSTKCHKLWPLLVF